MTLVSGHFLATIFVLIFSFLRIATVASLDHKV